MEEQIQEGYFKKKKCLSIIAIAFYVP